MEKEKKWYYIDYDTFGLPDEIEASSESEAEQIAIDYIMTNGIEMDIEEMEE